MIAALLAQVIAPGGTFACTPTRVWDGDGPIWCAEGPRVRLAGIAAREMDGSCRPGHPCPTASATASRDRLVSLLGGARGAAESGHILVRGPRLTCVSDGSAGGNRTAAWCKVPGGASLNCEMIASGHAAKWHRYWRDHRC